MGTPAPKELVKLGFGAADPVTTLLNFNSFKPGVVTELGDYNGTRGAYEKDGNRVTARVKRVAPIFSAEGPTATELGLLLAWGMYGTPTGTTTLTYQLGNTPAERFLQFFPTNGDKWFLTGCAVDEITLAATQGGPLRVDVTAVGKTADLTHTTFPSITPDATTRPFMLAQLVLTMGGVARNCRDFQFKITHGIDKDRFLNSLSITDIVPLKRTISFSVSVPSGDTATFWDDGEAGMTVAAVFTNAAGSVLSMAFPDFRAVPTSPDFDTGEGFTTMAGELYRGTSFATPIAITLTV